MNTEESRKEFEAWFISTGHEKTALNRHKFYVEGMVEEMWMAWQAAKAQPQWISVDDRLPENDSGLYLCSEHEGIMFACFRRRHEWIRNPQMKMVVSVTHWMPLPAAPEQNK